MGSRFQARQSNGRFTRNTLANTFGLQVKICPVCRAFNPYRVTEQAPTVCHACNASLNQTDEAAQ